MIGCFLSLLEFCISVLRLLEETSRCILLAPHIVKNNFLAFSVNFWLELKLFKPFAFLTAGMSRQLSFAFEPGDSWLKDEFFLIPFIFFFQKDFHVTLFSLEMLL